MNTRLDIDPEVLQLVRRVDPLLDPSVASALDTDADAVLELLASALEEPRPGPRRRVGYLTRAGLVACGAAGAAFLATNLASTGGGRLSGILRDSGAAVGPARAAMIVREAREALLYGPGSILEEEEVSRQLNADGSTLTSDFHSWVSTTPPYEASRSIVRAARMPAFEQEVVNGRLNLYDPSDNTIYEQAPPSHDLKAGPSPDTYLLTVPKAIIEGFCSRPVPAAERGTVALTISGAQATALRRGADGVEYVAHRGDVQTNPVVMPRSTVVPNNPNVTSAVAEIRYMLSQPGVVVDPNATLNNAPAVRISSSDGRFVYWASPGDYRPLQAVDKANGFVSTTKYPVYRVLSDAHTSSRIFSLAAQHPTARISTNGNDYAREKCRLGLGSF